MNLSGTRLDFGLYRPRRPLGRRWQGSRKGHRSHEPRRGEKVASGRKGRAGTHGQHRIRRSAQRARNAAALAAAGYFPRFRLSMALSKAASEKPSEYALGTTTVPPDPFTDS